MLRSRLQMYTGKEEDNEYNETAQKNAHWNQTVQLHKMLECN